MNTGLCCPHSCFFVVLFLKFSCLWAPYFCMVCFLAFGRGRSGAVAVRPCAKSCLFFFLSCKTELTNKLLLPSSGCNVKMLNWLVQSKWMPTFSIYSCYLRYEAASDSDPCDIMYSVKTTTMWGIFLLDSWACGGATWAVKFSNDVTNVCFIEEKKEVIFENFLSSDISQIN